MASSNPSTSQDRLERERGEVGRGGGEQPAQPREAGAFEIVIPVLERLAGGKGALLGREAVDVAAQRLEPRLGAPVGGERALPAAVESVRPGRDMYLYVSPARGARPGLWNGDA